MIKNPQVRAILEPGKPVWLSRAPGRLDVMGGIADYMGALVLQRPILQAALAAVQIRSDDEIKIMSTGHSGTGRSFKVSFSMNMLGLHIKPVACEVAQMLFRQLADDAWAAYPAGCLLVLLREKGRTLTHGISIYIQSEVPEGKGVSSSAALEVAVMQALAAALDIPLQPEELARLCQQAENEVVGAPCGIMDQMTATCGRANELLALRCQPAELLDPIHVPEDLSFFGIDSGIRHAVSGSDYTRVRTGAFMGYRILETHAGKEACNWNGYLANITPEQFETMAGHVPETLLGQEFLDAYGGTHDTVTDVIPDVCYAIRAPTAHPVYEHARINTFAAKLPHARSAKERQELGAWMYESHESYSACGLGSAGTDRLVELIRGKPSIHGLYGARITGGGCGGTVAVLADASARSAIDDICRTYEAETGHQTFVFEGSSEGAATTGVQTEII
ncbi:MAG: galactokinase [Kiritimatiellia bacterium]|jgi:galactokinase